MLFEGNKDLLHASIIIQKNCMTTFKDSAVLAAVKVASAAAKVAWPTLSLYQIKRSTGWT